ncbi:MAG TPA: ATP-binding protein [Gammaproteobacteria bacterium]|nr:ATP-binding protein [Gammaproteobacteria bacterium]
MDVRRDESFELEHPPDVVHLRQQARAWSIEMGFSLVEQTKIVTAASELARNTIEHGKGGTARFRWLVDGRRSGFRMDFVDEGPGIPDVQLALKDGYSTGTGLGLGLSGSRRLMNDFEIESTVGKGTRVSVTRWR